MGPMARASRTYDHFCVLARALEQVGDRWTLLVVRDLLSGPRRFTDLMDLLGGITPKTLSQRLRELEAAGVVEVDRVPGRREVWYRLTAAGEDLAPVVQSLFRWGIRHTRRPPAPGEKVHPEHLLKALRILLDDGRPPRHPLRWHVLLDDGGAYTLAFDGDGWRLATGLEGAEADVVVTADRVSLTRYLLASPDDRPADPPGVAVEGDRQAVARFARLLERFPPPT